MPGSMLEEVENPGKNAFNARVVDVLVQHHPDSAGRAAAHDNTAPGHVCSERVVQSVTRREEDHVGRLLDRAGPGLLQDSSKASGPEVIFGKPLHIVLKGIEAG